MAISTYLNDENFLTESTENKVVAILREFSISRTGPNKSDTSKEIECVTGLGGLKEYIYVGRESSEKDLTLSVKVHPDFCHEVDRKISSSKIKIGPKRATKLGRFNLSSNFYQFPKHDGSTQKKGAQYRVPLNDNFEALKGLLELIVSSK